MAKTIDIIKLNKYKLNRLNNKSKTQSLIDSGYSVKTANHKQWEMPLVKVGEEQIKEELNKSGLIEKAYKVLENCLNANKDSDKIAAAMNILKYQQGDTVKSIITDDRSKEIIELSKQYLLKTSSVT